MMHDGLGGSPNLKVALAESAITTLSRGASWRTEEGRCWPIEASTQPLNFSLKAGRNEYQVRAFTRNLKRT